jgi:opacity protein-like surface antigen
MNKLSISLIAALTALGAANTQAQESASDSVMNHAGGKRFSIGGYGEVAYSRNFYSDNGNRYTNPEKYKNDPSHGRFDIPHVVVYMGYDFGKGWTMGSEIEFEHRGTGSSIEYEADEAIEFEHEQERGGEVELEQFWLQKSLWTGKLNIRAGHIVVPVGLTNSKHEPLNFFTVYRPEGENTILPCTWHQTGLSIWGKLPGWRYEAQLLAGLNAFKFSRANWIQGGAQSPFEFDVANKYAVSARIDNYSVKGLRVGVSGYYGQSMHNSVPHDMESGEAKKLKGNVWIGSFDFTYKGHNILARGNADYGYVSDADKISSYIYPNTSLVKPYESGNGKYFGKNAIAIMLEAGYDVFSQIPKLKEDKQKLYVFGHFEYYDSYVHAKTKDWTNKRIWAAGINYCPLPQIAIKAEYNFRNLKKPFNDEPAINIGVAYEGFFL